MRKIEITAVAPLTAGRTPVLALNFLGESLVPPHRPGDFVQALMDLGATVCTPKAPTCALCPLTGACAARERDQKGNDSRTEPPQSCGSHAWPLHPAAR